MNDDAVTLIPGAPRFSWVRRSRAVSFDAAPDHLAIDAAGSSDHFVDPQTREVTATAPVLVADSIGPAMLSADVAVSPIETYDAAALMVYADDSHWAKFAIEKSPDGAVRVVSVVTNDVSDDCNHIVVGDAPIALRIAALGDGIYAFHCSTNGSRWDLIRYFKLAKTGRLGFSAQSPLGGGCAGHFTRLAWNLDVVKELRDGS